MEEALPSRTIKFDTGQICNGTFSNPWCYQSYVCVYVCMYISPPPQQKIILASCPCILQEKNRPVSLATPV